MSIFVPDSNEAPAPIAEIVLFELVIFLPATHVVCLPSNVDR